MPSEIYRIPYALLHLLLKTISNCRLCSAILNRHQYSFAGSWVATEPLLVNSLTCTIILLVLDREEPHQSMSIVNKITFKPCAENKQHIRHWVHHECPMLHRICRFVPTYLNKTHRPPPSASLLVIPVNFWFPRKHYPLYRNRPNGFKALGVYRLKSSSPSILKMTERSIFVAPQQYLLS